MISHRNTGTSWSEINGIKDEIDFDDFRKVGENKYRYYGYNFNEIYGDIAETNIPDGFGITDLYIVTNSTGTAQVIAENTMSSSMQQERQQGSHTSLLPTLSQIEQFRRSSHSRLMMNARTSEQHSKSSTTSQSNSRHTAMNTISTAEMTTHQKDTSHTQRISSLMNTHTSCHTEMLTATTRQSRSKKRPEHTSSQKAETSLAELTSRSIEKARFRQSVL